MDREMPPATIANRYRVMEEIGRGNIGRVFRVEHLQTGESFALKILYAHRGADPAMVERFQREARTPALVRSDHVVKVIDADVAPELDGAPFLVMELLDGVDLDAHLHARGRLPAGEAVGILRQVARALDRAHAMGVVHRDLKPANVFLHRRDEDVVVKVLDFGISKLAPSLPSDVAITASGQIMGTPLYMPPEQALGKPDIGPSADIWALGMLAYTLLTGRPYWITANMTELMVAIVRDPISAPSARERLLTPAFDAWFLRSCEKEPAERWGSAGEQVRRLAEALEVELPDSLTLPSADFILAVDAERRARGDLSSPHGGTSLPAAVPGAAVPGTARAGGLPPAIPPVARAQAPQAQRHGAVTKRASDSVGASQGGERRQITVLAFEVAVASMNEEEEVDPEDLRDVTLEYHDACAQVLGQVGGPVSQTVGDGVMVYFGYPVAQGDDASRAVSAALAIAEAVEAIRARAEKSRRVSVSLQAGIHTGLVVTAEASTLSGKSGQSGKEGGASQRGDLSSVVGQVPQVASRVKRMAPPNGVAVSAATHRLVKSAFLCETLENPEATGPDSRVAGGGVYRVVAAVDPETAETLSRSRAMVGRDSELHLLLDRWEEVKGGQGHFALVMGDAGLGKSTLVRAARDALAKQADHGDGGGATWLSLRTSPYFDNSQLHPFIDLLGRLAGFAPDDTPQTRGLRLRRAVEGAGAVETLPFLASLLGLPVADEGALRGLTPHVQRQRTHQAIVTLVHAMGRQAPVVIVFEDLHWADPSSLELLGMLVDQSATEPVFALMTARPEFTAAWTAKGHVTRLNLSRLAPKRVEALILSITGGKSLPPAVTADLVQKADGVPLFVEELTRHLLETGALSDTGSGFEERANATVDWSIPGTLRDSLTARLDRLGSAKSTAQLAATIGREFDYDVLRATTSLDDEELAQELRSLLDSELIYQRGVVPEARFTFKHALVQEAAYESLTKSARKQIHARIADALATHKPSVAAEQPEVMAHHLSIAGQPMEAAGYFLRAGHSALGRSANAEAIAHLSRGLDQLATAPEGLPRDRLEATFRTLIGVPLMATRGYAAPEVEQTYARARGLRGLRGSQEMLPVLWGLWIFYHVKAQYETASSMADQLIELVEGGTTIDKTRMSDAPSPSPDASSDPLRGSRVIAHLARGTTSMLRGELEAARSHLSRSRMLYDSAEHRDHAFTFGQDSFMFAGVFLGWTEWLLGRPDTAAASADAAIEYARTLGHANSIAFALGASATVHQYRRDVPTVLRLSSESIQLCTEQGLPHWLALARILHGWARFQSGERDAGLAEMKEGRGVWAMIGARVSDSHYDSIIAETLIEAGRLDEARQTLAAARAFIAESGERSFDAEVARLEVLASGSTEGAEEKLREALALAQGTGARSLELRVALSLGRVLAGDERRAVVERVLAAFDEGHDTGDLVAAKRFLAESTGA